MVLLHHLRMGLTLYIIRKQASQELEAPRRLLPPSKGEHLEQAQTSQLALISPKDKPIGSQMVGSKYPVHLHAPTMRKKKRHINPILVESTWFTWIPHSNKKDDSLCVNYGVASSSSWSNSTCNPKTSITRI